MRIDIITLFPGIFIGPLDESIVARAREAGILDIRIHDLRPFGIGRHRDADDAPYGGGGGMVMRPEPIHAALESILGSNAKPHAARVIHLSPQGRRLDHKGVVEVSHHEWLVLLCGRYEGIDQRVLDLWVDEEVSIGDYVLTGGELPALVLIDAVSRQIPGVLGNADSAPNDSFAQGILDCPHYTRPEKFEGIRVPEALLSGHHARIADWRRRQALKKTLAQRSDLLDKALLDEKDQEMLNDLKSGAEPKSG